MINQTFSLQPFSNNESLPNLQITGSIIRYDNRLVIKYTLTGNLKEVAIAPPSDTPARKHDLWEDTCFEFFLSIKGSQQYWEFNLSPTGHWNVYRFDGYRQGMQAETAFTILPFTVEQQTESFTLTLDIDLGKIVAANQALEVAITTVIKDRNSEVTYWALTHQGAEADFHLRDSFIIEL
ncbi:MAG: DOMON-like domain-containing protein [Nodularia sp. CChRGM 3473]